MALRDKLEALAEGPWLYPISALLGVLETSIVLVPVEPLIIPLMAGRGRRIWGIAAALLAGNLISAALVYWGAAAFAGVIIDPLVAWLNGEAAYHQALERLRTNGFIALVLIDLTPIPFQISMAAAGAAGFPFGLFLLAVTISRGVRHFAVAALIWTIGLRAQGWIEAHEREIFMGGLVIFAALGAWMLLSQSA
jgi:membrane protein YqaA with SNARE-associated domain